jgi:hypothetical protein
MARMTQFNQYYKLIIRAIAPIAGIACQKLFGTVSLRSLELPSTIYHETF